MIPSEALMNGEPPIDDFIPEGTWTPDFKFMAKLVEKGLLTLELIDKCIQSMRKTGSGFCYPDIGEPGHDGSPG